MSRTPLSFYCSYYVDTKVDPGAVTNYGGISPYLDLMLLVDLPKLVSARLPKKGMRAWQHAEHVAALLALNLTGGDCVDDLVKLDGDPGIGLYMGQIARAVGAQDRRFSRGGDRDIPSLTSVREWLDQFHNASEDAKRGYGRAFVPEANEALSGLQGVNREFVSRGFALYQRSGRPLVSRATLEVDASFMQTQKSDALACYKHFDAYSGLTVRWAVVVLAYNLHATLEKLAMPKGLIGSRFKRLRFHLINVPARLVSHARRCCVRYFQAATLHLVQFIRGELAALRTAFG